MACISKTSLLIKVLKYKLSGLFTPYRTSIIVISSIAACRSSNPASMTFLWNLILPGLPSGLPAEVFTDRILGGLESEVMSFLNVAHTVLMPDFSMYRAISPTDWVQSTQVGVRKAISTSSFLSWRPAFFALSMSGFTL